jgi:hypothetical protein
MNGNERDRNRACFDLISINPRSFPANLFPLTNA